MKAEPVWNEVRITAVMFALTVTAGAVDAVTFLGLGRAFAALATGNVLLLSFGVANAPGIPVAQPAEALAAFVVGVAAAHAIIVPVARRGRRWYVTALAGEVAVLAGTGVYAVIVSGAGSLSGRDKTIAVVLLAGRHGVAKPNNGRGGYSGHAHHIGAGESDQGTERCSVVPVGAWAGTGTGASPSRWDGSRRLHRRGLGGASAPARPRARPAVHRRIRGRGNCCLLPCPPTSPAAGHTSLNNGRVHLSAGARKIRRDGHPRSRTQACRAVVCAPPTGAIHVSPFRSSGLTLCGGWKRSSAVSRSVVSAHCGAQRRDGRRPAPEICGSPDRVAAPGAPRPAFMKMRYSRLIAVATYERMTRWA